MNPTLRRRAALCFALAATAMAWPALSSAQSYPNRPIRLVVPWPAGTPADVAGRIITFKLEY